RHGAVAFHALAVVDVLGLQAQQVVAQLGNDLADLVLLRVHGFASLVQDRLGLTQSVSSWLLVSCLWLVLRLLAGVFVLVLCLGHIPKLPTSCRLRLRR